MTEIPVSLKTVSSEYPTHDIDTDLSKMIAWFQDRLHEIPEEYRSSATVEFDDDGEGYTYSTISYKRPETHAEQSTRLKREDRLRRQEIATLKKLQAKYGKDLP